MVPVLDDDFEHDDVSQGGIYTQAELDSWKEHVEFGDLHQAITKTLTMGVCAGQGTCSAAQSAPVYNLQNLLASTDAVTSLNPFKRLSDWIEKSGVYVALLVLIIEGVKAIIFLTSIITTLVQEGVDGFKAIIYILCCGPLHQKDRIKRRGRQFRRHEYDDVTETDIPLRPRVPEKLGKTEGHV